MQFKATTTLRRTSTSACSISLKEGVCIGGTAMHGQCCIFNVKELVLQHLAGQHEQIDALGPIRDRCNCSSAPVYEGRDSWQGMVKRCQTSTTHAGPPRELINRGCVC